MKITVTQDDLDNGESRNCWRCPLAIAIRRAIGNPLVMVAVERWRVWIGNKSYRLPPNAAELVISVDQGHRRGMVPLTFELPIEEVACA